MSDGKKDPAMLFYGDDFYTDEAVQLMSLEQEAIYLRLLWHAWREGSIPADIGDLAAIVRIPKSRFRRLWERIAPKWIPAPEAGRLVNPRQEQEREERRARSRKLREAGLTGNERRWGLRSGGDRQAMPDATDSRSSPDRDAIPSSSKEEEEGGTRARATPEPDPGKPPGHVAPPADGRASDLRRALLDHGVLRRAGRGKLDGLVAAMLEDGWEPADVAEAAADMGGKNDEARAGRLASMLLDAERRRAYGDDLARRQSERRALA